MPSIVHMPDSGGSLCGLGPISKWPSGHLWCTDRSAINCPDCIRLLSQPIPADQLTDLTKYAKKLVMRPDTEERKPAFSDHDPMPFGKHKGMPMEDVPAVYLHWLWTRRPLSHTKLENYIHNNIPHLRLEHPDGIWT